MKKIYFFLMMLFAVNGVWGQNNFFAGDGSALTASKWGTSAAGPFTSAFTSGSVVNFAIVNGTGTGGSITIGGITAPESFTLTSISGTITNVSNGVVTIDVSSTKTVDLSTQAFTTSATAGYIKNGSGVFALGGATYGGGFTLNAGTLIARGVNAMGSGGGLTINGGIIAANANRDFSTKYAGGITVGGDFTLGATTGLASSAANLTFSNNMSLGNSTTRIITIGGTGTYTLGGIISGTSSNLTISSTAAGTIALTGGNTYSGTTTVNGGTLRLNKVGGTTLPNSNDVVVNGGTLQISTNQTLNNITLTSGATLTVDNGVTLTINGTFNYDGGTITLTGTGAIAYGSGATLIYGGTSLQTSTNTEFPSVNGPNSLTINNAAIVAFPGAFSRTLNGNFTIGTGASFDLNGNTLTVNGNMSNGGSFTPNAGTVDFAGTSGTQTLTTGGTGAGKTFYAVSHSGASTLQLATNNFKVTNNFTNNSGPFNGNGLNVNVGGDISVNGTYSSGGGILTFDGSTNQNWGGAGGNDYGDVVINKSAGNAILTSNVQVNNLTLTSGKVVLGANNITAGGSVTGGTSSNYIVTDGTGVLTINTVTGAKTFPIGDAKYNPLTINNSNGYNWSTRVADGLSADPGFNTDKAVLLTWNISPSVNPTATGTTVTFQYDEAITPGGQTGTLYNNSETVQAWHKPGAGWVMTGSPVLPGGVAGATTVTVSGLQNFSPYALANISGPLPVKFTNVKAYQQGSAVKIDWSNLTESNVANYVVERSANGSNFTTLSTIAAARNDGNRADYSSLDATPLIGINFYRIRSAEMDGKLLYSSIVKVNTKGGASEITIYPNPVIGGQVSLQTTSLNKGQYTLRIFNANGQQVFNQLLNHNGGAGTEVIQLPAALKAGMYNLQLIGGEVKLSQPFIIK